MLRYWDGSNWSDHIAPPDTAPRPGTFFGRRAAGLALDVLIMIFLDRVFVWPLQYLFGRALWVTLVMAAIMTAAWFSYEMCSLRRWGATPGMRVAGLAVRVGSPDSPAAIRNRALIFAVVFGVSPAMMALGPPLEAAGAIIWLGFIAGCLAPLVGKSDRTWHDRLSGTEIAAVDRSLVAQTPAVAQEAPLTTRDRNVIITLAGMGLLAYAIRMTVVSVAAIHDVRLP